MTAGHRMMPATRFTDALGRLVFSLRCECMSESEAWYATRLPQLYATHEWHLSKIAAASRAAHPSSKPKETT